MLSYWKLFLNRKNTFTKHFTLFSWYCCQPETINSVNLLHFLFWVSHILTSSKSAFLHYELQTQAVDQYFKYLQTSILISCSSSKTLFSLFRLLPSKRLFFICVLCVWIFFPIRSLHFFTLFLSKDFQYRVMSVPQRT